MTARACSTPLAPPSPRASCTRRTTGYRSFRGDIWVTAKGRLFDDEEGGAKRFAEVAVDITEPRKKEDERARLAKDLQAARRRQSEFLATLAHELRNPLATIRTALDLMRIGQLDSQATERLRGIWSVRSARWRA